MTEIPRAKILLVDDQPDTLLALEATLEPLDHTLVSANSGDQALRHLLRDDFAVILLDVRMPGLNGFETAEIIRSREQTRYVPIIFMTALSWEQESIRRGYSVGAVDYMVKPLHPEVLRSKVSIFVDLWRKNRQLQQQHAELQAVQRRELELRHRADLRETEARLSRIMRAELEAVNRELTQRTRDLQAALSARGRFYASMSHELRTPINAILGYGSLLLDQVYGPLNETQVIGIERTVRAARQLLELVNDVLDLSKIEAGRIELKLETLLFPALIEDLFVTVRPFATEHGSQLEMEHRGEPIAIVSDLRRVRQILLNLLSNATKFGRGNPICVISQPWGEGGVELKVVDRGIGIAAADQQMIFDEFVQLERGRQSGTGLGLPISRRLAVVLNGSLTVESEESRGSTFVLRLPRQADGLAGEESVPQQTETAA